jgi:hypothetical protein
MKFICPAEFLGPLGPKGFQHREKTCFLEILKGNGFSFF